MQVLKACFIGRVYGLTTGGRIRRFRDADGKQYTALDMAADCFCSNTDKVPIGNDAGGAA